MTTAIVQAFLTGVGVGLSLAAAHTYWLIRNGDLRRVVPEGESL